MRVVVIGAGATGLGAGALLGKLGHQVTVLEANPTHLGGHARTLEIDGCRFCVGPQYVWNFEPGRAGDRILGFLGLRERVPFDGLDPDCFERVVVGDELPFDVPLGVDEWFERLSERFPADREALSGVGRFVGSATEVAAWLDESGSYLKPMPRATVGALLSRHLPLRSKLAVIPKRRWTAGKLFDRNGLSTLARRTLYGHGAIFAEPWDEISAVAFGGASGLYHRGARYPRHGFESLIQGLRATIEASGGTVRLGTPVQEIVVEAARVRGVRCTDGEVVPADVVFSNASPAATRRMLGAASKPSEEAPSPTLLTLCLAVEGYPDLESRLRGRHLWWHRSATPTRYYDSDADPAAMLYVGSPSAQGPTLQNEKPNRHSVVVFALDSWAEAKMAEAQGAAAVEDRRGTMIEAVLEVIDERLLPGVKPYTEVLRVLGAAETAAEVRTDHGNVYGRRFTPDEMFRAVPQQIRGVGGLWMGSASVGFAGIAQCLRTAEILTERITGAPLPREPGAGPGD